MSGSMAGSLVGVIIWVFVIVSIVNSIRSKGSKGGNGQNKPVGNSSGYGQSQGGQTMTGRQTNPVTQGSARQQGTPPAAGRTGNVIPAAQPRKMTQQDKNKESTTDYLQRKAFEDEQEHLREQMEEESRVKASTGGLPQAERLIEGDSVPAGRKMKVCSYCGAQNLIPENARGKCTCYFCREIL